jgi:hypothetical protein
MEENENVTELQKKGNNSEGKYRGNEMGGKLRKKHEIK